MRKKNKLVCGVGINDSMDRIEIDHITNKSYGVWTDMLSRCYSSKFHIKFPSYIGCIVCDEWKYYTTFEQWFDKNYVEGFHLDKDILIEGNKTYSPDTCRFVPPNINTILSASNSIRGDYPQGVSKNHNSYTARCRYGVGREVLRKTFKTIPEAQAWYSATKHQIVKERAIEAFLAGEIMSDVASALINRKF